MVSVVDEALAGKHKILARMPAPSRASFLPVGVAYNRHAKRDAIAADREALRLEKAREISERKAKEKAHAALLAGEANDKSHYGILGLSHLGIEATTDDINKAYRDLLVVYHPDKSTAAWLAKKEAEEKKGAKPKKTGPKMVEALGGGVEEEEKEETLDERFTRLTLAYETLTDIKRRRDYDSTYGKIDDSVPTAEDVPEGDEEAFYKVYGDAFRRNARWSEIKPVPQLGGPDATWEEVSEFYEFWFDFQSWRSFPKSDKHRVEEAGERDERRWMEQENKRIRAKLVKEESSRIMKLVETAHRLDPRVQRHMAEEKERKNAKKNARKREAEEAAAAEAKAKAEAEAAAAAAEADAKAQRDAAKKEKEKAKKALQKQRKRFRELAQACDQSLVEEICLAHKEEGTLLEVCDRVESGAITAQQAVDEFVAFKAMSAEEQAKHEEEARARADAALKAKAEAEAEAKKAKEQQSEPWTPQELALLLDGFQRFPGGTPQRWAAIAGHVATRTEPECIEMAKVIKKDASQIKSQVCAVGNKDVSGGNASSSATSASAPATSSSSARGGSVDEDAPKEAMAAWTQEEQKKLEAALKEFPASMPKSERFEKVAERVGRSKKDCFARFKEIVLELKREKEAKK